MSYTADEHSCYNSRETNPELYIITSEKGQRESKLPLSPRRSDPRDTISPQQRLRARLGLPSSSTLETDSPEVIFSNLFSKHWATRLRAVRRVATLWKEVPDLVKGALTHALRDDSPYVRAAAARGLASFGEQAPVALLLQAVEDRHWQVRAAAVVTLGQLGPLVPVESLRRCLVDEEPVVQKAALHTLSNLGELRFHPDLRRALDDEDPRVRLTAVQLLGNWNGSVAVNELLTMLFDIDEEIRYEALQILSQKEEIRHEALQILSQKRELALTDLLLTILNDQQENIRVRLKVLQILRIHEEPLPLEPLLISLKDPNQQIRENVSKLLGEHDLEIPQQVSSTFLLQLLQDEFEDLRAVAAWALGKQQAQEARQALLKAKDDSSELVQLAVEQALASLKEAGARSNDQLVLKPKAKEERVGTQDVRVQFLASLTDYLQDKYGEVHQETQQTPSGLVLILYCRFQSNQEYLQDTVLGTLAGSTSIEPVDRALQSQDEVVRVVAERESQRLQGKTWSELFITSLELLQDARVQMEVDVPVKIILCSVGLLLSTERTTQVSVLDEIVEAFQREAICEYSRRICSQRDLIGNVAEHHQDKVDKTPQVCSLAKPNTSWLGKTLKSIQAWYEASSRSSQQILCF